MGGLSCDRGCEQHLPRSKRSSGRRWTTAPSTSSRAVSSPDAGVCRRGGSADGRSREGSGVRPRGGGQGPRPNAVRAAISRPPYVRRREQVTGTAPTPSLMPLDLTGRSAIVVGASSGIGRVIAADLTGYGATVAWCARRADIHHRGRLQFDRDGERQPRARRPRGDRIGRRPRHVAPRRRRGPVGRDPPHERDRPSLIVRHLIGEHGPRRDRGNDLVRVRGQPVSGAGALHGQQGGARGARSRLAGLTPRSPLLQGYRRSDRRHRLRSGLRPGALRWALRPVGRSRGDPAAGDEPGRPRWVDRSSTRPCRPGARCRRARHGAPVTRRPDGPPRLGSSAGLSRARRRTQDWQRSSSSRSRAPPRG